MLTDVFFFGIIGFIKIKIEVGKENDKINNANKGKINHRMVYKKPEPPVSGSMPCYTCNLHICIFLYGYMVFSYSKYIQLWILCGLAVYIKRYF